MWIFWRSQIDKSFDPQQILLMPGQAGRRAFQVGGNRHTTTQAVSVAAQTIDKDGGQRRRA